jgi:hypothetical protein
MCAIDPGGTYGGCNGDSGGTRVAQRADQSIAQIGITSFGASDCSTSRPGFSKGRWLLRPERQPTEQAAYLAHPDGRHLPRIGGPEVECWSPAAVDDFEMELVAEAIASFHASTNPTTAGWVATVALGQMRVRSSAVRHGLTGVLLLAYALDTIGKLRRTEDK